MEVIINSDFQLTLPNEEWTTAVFRYNLNTTETLSIFRGTGKCSNEDQKNFIVIKMQIKPGDEMLANMITRFEAGKSLDKRYFILSQRIARDNQYIYFCYESFDHNLQTLMAAVVNEDVNQDEWRKVVIGCMKALAHLHKLNKTHGHITSYNLVRSNGNGYLMGGVGEIFTQWNNTSDPFKYDVNCLVEAISSCIPPVMNTVELNYLLNFLRYHQTMNHILYHPYIQSSTGVVALFIPALDVLDKKCNDDPTKYTSTYNCFLSIFTDVMNRHQYIASRNWKMNMSNIPPNSTLSMVFNGHKNGKPINYENDNVGLFRFWRNVFVHAKKEPQNTVEQHHDTLYNMLNAVWPGFAYMVYEVIYEPTYGVFF